MMREVTIVDATLIAAPPRPKNRDEKRDPELHQSKKGKNRFFGMRAHIGVDAKSGLTHTLVTTAASVRAKVEHPFHVLKNLFKHRKMHLTREAPARFPCEMRRAWPCRAIPPESPVCWPRSGQRAADACHIG